MNGISEIESLSYAKLSLKGSNMIVCGRGKSFDLLPGNLTFRQVISKYASQYSSFQNSRAKKSILIRWIASHLKECGMIFVKRTKNDFQELNESEILIKIGHALRDVPKLLQKLSSLRKVDRSVTINRSKKTVVKNEMIPSLCTTSRDDAMEKSKASDISTSYNSDCSDPEQIHCIDKENIFYNSSQNCFHLSLEGMNELTESIFDDDIDKWSIQMDLEIPSPLKEEGVCVDVEEALLDRSCSIGALFDDHNVDSCHLCQKNKVEVCMQLDEAMLFSVAESLGIGYQGKINKLRNNGGLQSW